MDVDTHLSKTPGSLGRGGTGCIGLTDTTQHRSWTGLLCCRRAVANWRMRWVIATVHICRTWTGSCRLLLLLLLGTCKVPVGILLCSITGSILPCSQYIYFSVYISCTDSKTIHWQRMCTEMLHVCAKHSRFQPSHCQHCSPYIFFLALEIWSLCCAVCPLCLVLSYPPRVEEVPLPPQHFYGSQNILTLYVLRGGYHVWVHRCGVSSLQAVVKARLLVRSHLFCGFCSRPTICLLWVKWPATQHSVPQLSHTLHIPNSFHVCSLSNVPIWRYTSTLGKLT
jgi:hypothetical protein